MVQRYRQGPINKEMANRALSPDMNDRPIKRSQKDTVQELLNTIYELNEKVATAPDAIRAAEYAEAIRCLSEGVKALRGDY